MDAETEERPQFVFHHFGMLEELFHEEVSFFGALLFAMSDEKKKILLQMRIMRLDEDHRIDIFSVDASLNAEDKGEDIDLSDILDDAVVDESSDRFVG